MIGKKEGKTRMTLTLAVILLAAPLALAQTTLTPPPTPTTPAVKPLAFDVVSIKPNHSGSPAMIDHTPPDGYSVENYPVRMVISQAYGIRLDLISGGPSWLDSDHYDVIAKIAGEDISAYRLLSKDQRNQMLQTVLADRLHLVTHTLIKPMSGYTLTIAKSGSKLVEAKPGARGGWGAGPGSIRTTGITIASLCNLLSNIQHQTVLDQTGLKGKYVFDLRWADLNARPNPADAADPSSLPALPTALEETLGLKLTSTKIDTTTLVIDSAEKPTPN